MIVGFYDAHHITSHADREEEGWGERMLLINRGEEEKLKIMVDYKFGVM